MKPAITRLKLTGASVALLALGAGGGYGWAQRTAPAAIPADATATAATGERKVLYWYDPMMPDQRFEKPGKSPFMDMALVPKYADDVGGGGIRIEPGLQQNVAIRTATVSVGRLAGRVRVPGTLGWDLRRESVISARTEGLVTAVQVKAPYTPVRRGQALAAVMAPAWSSAQAEANALRQAQSPAARELQAAAQQRLRVLGVGNRHAGRDGSTALAAPRDGIVTEVWVREGQTVAAGTPMFRINGLDTLWLEAAVPQAATRGLVSGTPVEARVDAVPGQVFRGHVEALLPQVDAGSRTQQARIVLQNPDHRLVPGMFAEVTLQPDAGAPLPLVPTEALIATGTDSRIIVQETDGSFRSVAVTLGRSGNGQSEIVAGLRGGERVVVSGQFLIDSEASLSGALTRLDPASPSAATPSHSHASAESGTGSPAEAGHEGHGSSAPASASAARTPIDAERCPVQYWYDPMVPDKHFDQAGKSPFMDMQLVPKFAPRADAACTAGDVANTETKP